MKQNKAKVINMFEASNNADTELSNDYYDDQERKEVESIEWKWDYLNKCELFSYDGIDDDEDENLLDNYDPAEEERKAELVAEHDVELLKQFKNRIIKCRKDAISQRAINDYTYLLGVVKEYLGEEDEEDDFVIDHQHIAELKQKRREESLKHQLQELKDERQRYLDAVQESESLIAKLKERNASPVVIEDEQALINKNQEAIKELSAKIVAIESRTE